MIIYLQKLEYKIYIIMIKFCLYMLFNMYDTITVKQKRHNVITLKYSNRENKSVSNPISNLIMIE